MNIKKKIDENLRRPNVGNEALCNVVADVLDDILDNSSPEDPGIVCVKFDPQILYSDLTKSVDLIEGKTPIAIEVVPASHMADGKSRWMSLNNMSLADPENGTTAKGDNSENPGAGIKWGYESAVVNEVMTQQPSVKYITTAMYVDTEVFTDNVAYKDGPSGPIGIESIAGVAYPGAPIYSYITSGLVFTAPPFNADGSANPNYRATEVNGEAIKNPLSQFNGAELTAGIIAMATATETEGPIENSTAEGHYPAAMCCHRYVTEGTNAGDWYLPAAGELGYAVCSQLIINSKIRSIIEAGFDAVCIPEFTLEGNNEGLGQYLWSSSEYSSDDAYNILYSGYVFNDNKGYGYSYRRVRAFLAL